MAVEKKKEILENLKAKKAKAIELADTRNKLEANDEHDKAREIEVELTELVNQYTQIAKNLAYDECKHAKNPMVAACKKLNYQTIRVKETDIEDSTQTELSIEDTEKPIKLRELHKKCSGIGVDQKWIYAVEKFNQLMTARQATRIGIDPKAVFNSYFMDKLAKDIKLGEDLLSEQKLIAGITQVTQMMIGKKYEPDIKDVYALIDTYAKMHNRKALRVVCANHEKLTRQFQQICHRCLLDKEYELEYKEAKN